MVSSDDDMRPFALMEDSPESLQADEISRGRLHKAGKGHAVHKSFDILAAFKDVLGKPVAEIPENYERGELLVDTAMDLETNATKGSRRRELADAAARRGRRRRRSSRSPRRSARAPTTSTRSTSSTCSSPTRTRSIPMRVNDLYVLVNFRPVVTNRNWRMDCGVAGYDNTFGLPPFFPTRLRFEDYIYRLWVQQDGVVAAHVDAAQHHTRSGYMRNPPAAEIFNEEVSNLIKRKIKASVTRLDELSVAFDYNGEVTAADAQEVLDKIVSLHTRALDAVAARGDAGTRRRAAAVRRQPEQGVLRLRARLLPAEPGAHRRRRHQRRSRARSSCGRRWSRSATSRRSGTGCRSCASRTRRRASAMTRDAGGAERGDANRAGRAAVRARAAAALRRHRAGRVLPHRGAGAARPRRDAVRQRRLGDQRPPRGRRVRARCGAIPRSARRCRTTCG